MVKFNFDRPNQLFYGDNLGILRAMPAEVVDLCYIDPPFNSKRNYFQIYNGINEEVDKAQSQAFMDTWQWGADAILGMKFITDLRNLMGNDPRFVTLPEQTVNLMKGLQLVLGETGLMAYLVSMTLRIAEIHRVLKPSGSFYLHCDPTASHYLKLICDSIFCARNRSGLFIAEICWERTNSHNMASKSWLKTHDILLNYAKSEQFCFNNQYLDYGQQQLKRYRQDETGRWYTGQDLTFSTVNPTRQFEWRGAKPPAHRSWGASLEQLENWYAEGRILLKKDGVPRLDGRKVYLDEMPGKSVSTLWNDIARIGNTSGERLGYPTQKPEALLERIVRASSNPGDLVLDAYCGCGTTVAVAERLGRRWIGIDITYQSISLILKRLRDSHAETWSELEQTIYLSGIPEDLDSARALANNRDDRLRKEFEKWAVLTYSNNQAVINDKKGKDQGIDGISYFLKDRDPATNRDSAGKVIYQVKSGKVGAKDVPGPDRGGCLGVGRYWDYADPRASDC